MNGGKGDRNMELTEKRFQARLKQLKANLEAAKKMEYGIDTRTFFVPMHEPPVFRKMGLFEGESCPVAEELARTGMYPPSSSSLSGSGVRGWL